MCRRGIRALISNKDPRAGLAESQVERPMARRNQFGFSKRQREVNRKVKSQEKMARRQGKKKVETEVDVPADEPRDERQGEV